MTDITNKFNGNSALAMLNVIDKISCTCLNTVFQEEGSSHDVISNITFHHQIMSIMDVHSTVKRIVESAFSDIGAWHITIDVEVDGVSAKSEGLSSIGDLNILNASSY